MKEFINTVLKHRENYINESITYREYDQLKKKVMKTLGLSDMGELRDKYEGEAFLNNFVLKIISVLILQKILNRELINLEEVNPKDYMPVVNISGVDINVITCEYGELPIIQKDNRNPAILNVKRKQKDVWICGYASVDVLNKYQSEKGVTAIAAKNPESRVKFTGFGELKTFKSEEELLELINK